MSTSWKNNTAPVAAGPSSPTRQAVAEAFTEGARVLRRHPEKIEEISQMLMMLGIVAGLSGMYTQAALDAFAAREKETYGRPLESPQAVADFLDRYAAFLTHDHAPVPETPNNVSIHSSLGEAMFGAAPLRTVM